MFAGGHERVDLDANFAIGIEMKMIFRECEEALDLFGREVRWGAAAPMKLNDGAIFRDAAADALHFLLQHVKIRRGDIFVFFNDYVAGATGPRTFPENTLPSEQKH